MEKRIVYHAPPPQKKNPPCYSLVKVKFCSHLWCLPGLDIQIYLKIEVVVKTWRIKHKNDLLTPNLWIV